MVVKKKFPLFMCCFSGLSGLMGVTDVPVPVFLLLTAQPNLPKIHEGWWAYKEMVQGSFVPGKPSDS